VADPENCTSVTVAVHFEFGHEPAGAVGSAVLKSRNENWPFLVVGKFPVLPEASKLKLWPGATLPAGFSHWTLATASSAETSILNLSPPRPATFPEH
jgi:hypothetical protein